MHTLTTCRALLSGATMLAATAMAAPQPAVPPSPCLAHKAADGAHPAQPAALWHRPCHLSDADKAAPRSQIDDTPADDEPQPRRDDIIVLGGRPSLQEDMPQLSWWEVAEGNHADGGAPAAAGGPGSWAPYENARYRFGTGETVLDPRGAHVQSDIPAVPEPGSAALWAAGLALLAGMARRRERQVHPFRADLSAGKAPPAARR